MPSLSTTAPSPRLIERSDRPFLRRCARFVVRIIRVLLDVVPQAAPNRRSIRIEQIDPRILSALDGVRDHDPASVPKVMPFPPKPVAAC